MTRERLSAVPAIKKEFVSSRIGHDRRDEEQGDVAAETNQSKSH
jgi:hypothetical protein